MSQRVILQYGEFPNQPCAICGNPALIRVAPAETGDPPRYFCEAHLRQAQALRDYLAGLTGS